MSFTAVGVVCCGAVSNAPRSIAAASLGRFSTDWCFTYSCATALAAGTPAACGAPASRQGEVAASRKSWTAASTKPGAALVSSPPWSATVPESVLWVRTQPASSQLSCMSIEPYCHVSARLLPAAVT